LSRRISTLELFDLCSFGLKLLLLNLTPNECQPLLLEWNWTSRISKWWVVGQEGGIGGYLIYGMGPFKVMWRWWLYKEALFTKISFNSTFCLGNFFDIMNIFFGMHQKDFRFTHVKFRALYNFHLWKLITNSYASKIMQPLAICFISQCAKILHHFLLLTHGTTKLK